MDIKTVRHMVIMIRGGYGHAICDYCHQNRGTDLHHIISRGRTHNDAARDMAQVPCLMSWVCQDCHIGTFNVHNPEATQELLWFNVHLFGYNAVLDALNAVSDYLTYPIKLRERLDDADEQGREESQDRFDQEQEPGEQGG